MVRFNEAWNLFQEKKKNESLSKKFLVTLPDNVNVYLVNGETLRNTIETDWIGGGHYYVPYTFIPENEIWVEDLKDGKKEIQDILLHEIIERKLMKYKKYTYEDGHAVATKFEKLFRENGKDSEDSLAKIFDQYFNEYFKDSDYVKNGLGKKIQETIKKIKI